MAFSGAGKFELGYREGSYWHAPLVFASADGVRRGAIELLSADSITSQCGHVRVGSEVAIAVNFALLEPTDFLFEVVPMSFSAGSQTGVSGLPYGTCATKPILGALPLWHEMGGPAEYWQTTVQYPVCIGAMQCLSDWWRETAGAPGRRALHRALEYYGIACAKETNGRRWEHRSYFASYDEAFMQFVTSQDKRVFDRLNLDQALLRDPARVINVLIGFWLGQREFHYLLPGGPEGFHSTGGRPSNSFYNGSWMDGWTSRKTISLYWKGSRQAVLESCASTMLLNRQHPLAASLNPNFS